MTECRYIMFCALTIPVPEAVTDFGVIFPLIVFTKTILVEADVDCAIEFGVKIEKSAIIAAKRKVGRLRTPLP